MGEAGLFSHVPRNSKPSLSKSDYLIGTKNFRQRKRSGGLSCFQNSFAPIEHVMCVLKFGCIWDLTEKLEKSEGLS
jgi:hypothetical protein